MLRSLICFLGFACVLLFSPVAARAGGEEGKKAEEEPFKRLSVDEVVRMLADPNTHVYDGNSDDQYLEAHVPGAVHMLPKEMKEGVLPSDPNTPLIFYCHNEK